jgi:hypothetical protein
MSLIYTPGGLNPSPGGKKIPSKGNGVVKTQFLPSYHVFNYKGPARRALTLFEVAMQGPTSNIF